jgi:sugar phosphate isomerase/epimerase
MTIDSTKAIHTWSLFRTLGSFAAPGTMPALEGRTDGAADPVALLDLPALLASHGFRSAQICHFSLPSTDSGYLADLRGAFADAGVALECFLVDHGDLADPAEGGHWRGWIDDWIRVAEQLGAPKVRVSAGDQPPAPDTIERSAESLRALAAGHDGIRVLVENWQGLLVDADSTLELLDRCEGAIGFLADFGNWSGPGKYEDLARVAPLAEACQAKAGFTEDGAIDAEDYRSCLRIMSDAGYGGPLSIVVDPQRPDVFARLDEAHALIRAEAGTA